MCPPLDTLTLSGESPGLVSVICLNMLDGLKLTPAASPTEFVDIFYDSEALLSTPGYAYTSRRVRFLRNQVTDSVTPTIPAVPKD